MKKITGVPLASANGSASAGRIQKGMSPLETPRVSEDVLRKMDHPEWLETFAKVMQMKTGPQMTPMRAGVINRSLMAAEYIRLLRHDVKKLETEVARLKDLAIRLEQTVDEHKLDRDLDRHQEDQS